MPGCSFDGTEFAVERIEYLRFCSFANCDLSKFILENLHSCTLVECDLGVFTGINANECTFDNCTATRVGFTNLFDSKVLNCQWPGLTVQDVREVGFSDCDLTSARFSYGSIEDVCLTRCDLKNSEFIPNGLDLMSVMNCNTTRCTFKGTPITDLTFEVDQSDESYDDSFNSKEMTFAQCGIEALQVIGVNMQLATFDLCNFDSSKFEDSNVSGTLFTDSTGEIDIFNCTTIALSADDRSSEDLQIFFD